MATNKGLGAFDAKTVQTGTILWLKDSSPLRLSTFLDTLVGRGLDMIYVGPGDRYKVVAKTAGSRMRSRRR